jgi:hypothetical protein
MQAFSKGELYRTPNYAANFLSLAAKLMPVYLLLTLKSAFGYFSAIDLHHHRSQIIA